MSKKALLWGGVAVILLVLGYVVPGQAADKAREGSTVLVEYTMDVDGKQVVGKDKLEAVQLVLGQSKFPPAFEKQLVGLKKGASRVITLEPEQAFGPVRPDLLKRIPKSQLPPNFPAEEGRLFATKGGGVLRVAKVLDDSVVIDQNHPLAGKVLKYTVTVKDVQ